MSSLKIEVSSTNPALAEVGSTALYESLRTIPGCELGSPGEVRTRFTGLEIVATIMTSAAATQLAHAVRDLVKERKVDITLSRPDGTRVAIRIGGLVPVERILAFLASEL
jgi:hypothetical protein